MYRRSHQTVRQSEATPHANQVECETLLRVKSFAAALGDDQWSSACGCAGTQPYTRWVTDEVGPSLQSEALNAKRLLW